MKRFKKFLKLLVLIALFVSVPWLSGRVSKGETGLSILVALIVVSIIALLVVHWRNRDKKETDFGSPAIPIN